VLAAKINLHEGVLMRTVEVAASVLD